MFTSVDDTSHEEAGVGISVNGSGRLTGSVAIVTGAGSGIGQATAALFAREGASVLVADIDSTAAQTTSAGIEAVGGRSRAATVDVSDAASVRTMVATAIRDFGDLDILVNNAGIGVVGDVVDTSDADLDRILAVNVKGTFLGCREAIPHMLERGGGVIVNVASAAAIAAVSERAAYVASKGAIIALTKAISIDFIARGIRCNCVAPGTVDSPWVSSMIRQYDEPAEAHRAMVARQPLGRLGRPEEIAESILFLASPQATFVHGTCLIVDGGFTSR